MKITENYFVQLKPIDMGVRKTIFFLRLSSTYFAFGCKKCICKKCYIRNRFVSKVSICNTWKSFVCVNFSNLLQGNVIKYGFKAF